MAYQVFMPKMSKKQSPWWWVEGAYYDQRGVRQWAGLFNLRNQWEAKAAVRFMGDLPVRNDAVGPNTYVEVRVREPGPERDVIGDINAANAKAFAGTCPACGKKPGKHKVGRWRSYPAWKCSRCGHMWASGASRLPPKPPERPSKGSKKKNKGGKAKKKSKKA